MASSRADYERQLDDLEIAGHFPVGDGAAELTLLPFAGGGVMLDEVIAEQAPRRGALLQTPPRFRQRARQSARGRKALLIGVALDGRVRLDAIGDAPQARADGSGERD